MGKVSKTTNSFNNYHSKNPRTITKIELEDIYQQLGDTPNVRYKYKAIVDTGATDDMYPNYRPLLSYH